MLNRNVHHIDQRCWPQTNEQNTAGKNGEDNKFACIKIFKRSDVVIGNF
jgi:hypothetical protein